MSKFLLALLLLPCWLSARVLVWGNMARHYLPLLAAHDAVADPAPRPPLTNLSEYRLVAFVFSGRPGFRFSAEEARGLQEYVAGGGVLLLDVGVPSWFATEENPRDLGAGAPLLGSQRYVYAGTPAESTPAGSALLGDTAAAVSALFDGSAPQPGLSGTGTLIPLCAGQGIVRLGVNRFGQGAVVYTALRAGSAPALDQALQTLCDTLLDPDLRERHFPRRLSNRLATINGRELHLRLAAHDAAAGRLLQDILERASGQEDFSLLPDTEEFVIHVGRNPYVESLGLDFASLHEYGYFMVCRDGRNLVLAGKNPAANSFAVMDFLKRHAGYRQFGHSRYTEVLPPRQTLTLPERLELREEPDIPSYTVAWPANPAFGRSARTSCLCSHSLFRLVPPEKFAKTHPEYFPEVDGRRVAVGEKSHGTWNPCLANPQLPTLLQEYARDYFSKNPDKLGLPLGVNDGAGDCQCAHCRGELERYGNQYAEFYNQMARALREVYPDKVVAMIAYSRRATAPPRNIHLEPNILVEICGISQDPFAEMTRWREAGARHIGLYDYLYTCGQAYVTPRYNAKLIAEAWKKARREFNLQTLWIELYPTTYVFEAPRQYILDETAWNIDSDPDALLDDYCQTMYGPAAPAVRRFFDRLEEISGRRRYPLFFFYDRHRETQMDIFTLADLDYLGKEMAAAASLAANHPESAWKVSIISRFYELVRLYIACTLEGRALLNQPVPATQTDALNRLQEAANACRTLETWEDFTLTEEEEKNIFTPKNSLQSMKTAMYSNPRQSFEPRLDAAMDNISAGLRQAGGDQAVRAFWQQHLPDSRRWMQRAITTQLYLLDHPPVNLFPNPGFEARQGEEIDEAAMSQYDWNRFPDGLKGWTVWHFQNSVTKFYWDNAVRRSGQYAVAIGENQIAGCIQTGITIIPGARYRFSIYVKTNNPEAKGQISLRFMQGGKWFDSAGLIAIPYPAECTGDWTRVGTTFTAPIPPEPAKLGLLPLLNAPIQEPGYKTWFDDAELVQIAPPPAP